MRKQWHKFHYLIFEPERIIRRILQSISQNGLIHPRFRPYILKAMGVNFSELKSVFIGRNVTFDEMRPDLIFIGRNVYITEGTKMLTHFYSPDRPPHEHSYGKLVIEDDVFIGINAVFVKPLTIGRGAVIGANCVLRTDIPEMSIVAGNPAEIVSKRPPYSES
jgi:acetyltransferase-like isoleucine patch superfamily enzyme